MPLWRRLYATVWLAFFACVLTSRWMPHVGTPVHVVLGILLILVTLSNARSLAALPVPERLKRISKVTFGFAIVQIVGGLVLGGVLHAWSIIPKVHTILYQIHAVCALIILAQASSVATAYDMWEEKEYDTPVAPAKKDHD
jgi:hypothetical protein